jgi:hypothetical protein
MTKKVKYSPEWEAPLGVSIAEQAIEALLVGYPYEENFPLYFEMEKNLLKALRDHYGVKIGASWKQSWETLKSQEGVMETVLMALIFVISQDEAVVASLLETEGYIEFQNMKLDPFGILGVEKVKGRFYGGSNLYGHALMHVRALNGGKGNPRLQGLGAKSQWDYASLAPALGEDDLSIQAQVWLDLGLQPETPLEEGEEPDPDWVKMKRLVRFMSKTGFRPYPTFRGDVQIQDNEGLNIPYGAMAMLALQHQLDSEVQFNYSWKGEADEFDLDEDCEFVIGGKTHNLQIKKPIPGGKKGKAVRLTTDFYMWFFCEAVARLSVEQQVELAGILCTGSYYKTCEVEGTRVHLTQDGHKFSVDFASRDVIHNEARRAFPTIALKDAPAPCSSAGILIYLLMEMEGASAPIRKQAALLNNVPNLWERKFNYGTEPALDSPTRHIKDGSLMCLSTRLERKAMGLGLVNEKFTKAQFLQGLAHPDVREAPYTDKVSKDFIAHGGMAALTSFSYGDEIRAGVMALDAGADILGVYSLILSATEMLWAVDFIHREQCDGRIPLIMLANLWTGLDGAKAPKQLNRAHQGAVYNFISSEIEDCYGEKNIHEDMGILIQVTPSFEELQIATQQDQEDLLKSLM